MLETVQAVTNEVYTDEFQILSDEAIELACMEFDLEVELLDRTELEAEGGAKSSYLQRAPIITIMGHVDHGKTTLLDAFRTDHNKCAEEYGAITQSIGAFTLKDAGFDCLVEGNEALQGSAAGAITFIDTPGHEAFQSMRARGAKVTDMIILVISAVESVQKQTVEVIELARSMHIPTIVAINKIDRVEADVPSVMLDLAANDLVPEDLGGDVICVPISAKEKVNLDLLKQRIQQVATERINLLEDHTVSAQCLVIESNVGEKSGQITATVIVKKGTLRLDDTFVSGIHEGKARFMVNDLGQNVKEAFPGEAVHLGGFKHFPEVGNPLYVVKSPAEVRFIVDRMTHRSQLEEIKRLAASKQIQVHELKKQMGKLTRLEKSQLKKGDKTILYEKLGLLEEKDLKAQYAKFGVKEGDAGDEEAVMEQIQGKQLLGRKRQKSGFHNRRATGAKEHALNMMADIKEEKLQMEQLTEEELMEANAKKAQMKQLFRDDEDESTLFVPLILKASQAGALETLLTEATKVIS